MKKLFHKIVFTDGDKNVEFVYDKETDSMKKRLVKNE